MSVPAAAAVIGTEPRQTTAEVGVGTSTYRAPIFQPPTVASSYSNSGDSRPLLKDPFQLGSLWTVSYGSGVWKSVDGGRSWSPKSKGLINLMIDSIRFDPNVEGLMYAVQANQAGVGNGLVYRSTDRGESWHPVGVCRNTFPRKTPVNGMDIGPQSTLGSPGDLWMAFGLNLDDCGFIYRSVDRGDNWCAFSPNCNFPSKSLPVCTGDLGDMTLDGNYNDGWSALTIRGQDEVYFLHSKMFREKACRNTFRTTSTGSSLRWNLDDRWADPTAQTTSCNGWEIDRLRTLDLDYDRALPNYRFGTYKLFSNITAQLTDLHLAYHKGDISAAGDRLWYSLFPLKDSATCFNMPSTLTIADSNPVLVDTADGTKVVAAVHRGANNAGEGYLFLCSSTNIDDCTQVANWDCVWKNRSVAPDCAAVGACPTPPISWFQTLWTKEVIRSTLLNGKPQAVLTARQMHARNEFVSVYHDGTTWHSEHLKDPVTCDPSGPELLTPLDVLSFSPSGRVLSSAPRHLFEKDGTLPFTAWGPHGFFDSGPILRQAPSNPAVVYALNWDGIQRSVDEGNTFNTVEVILNKDDTNNGFFGCLPCEYVSHCQAQTNCPPACWHLCGPSGACSVTDYNNCIANGFFLTNCGHTQSCGRANVADMCGRINDIIVDQADPDRLYAATDRGLWRWQYPFAGSGPCSPRAIDPQCLRYEAATLSGEIAWSMLQPTCPSGSECVRDVLLRTVAQDPSNGQHFLAAGRDLALTPQRERVWESTDGGATWALVAGLTGASEDAAVARISFLPGGVVLFAGETGVWRRNALGLLLTLPLPARDLSYRVIASVTHVYAAVMDWSDTTFFDGVYHSEDGGANWKKVIATHGNQRATTVHVTEGGTVYFGVLGSGLLSLGSPEATKCATLREPASTPGARPGDALLGTAVTALGDFGDFAGPPTCDSKWAALEFQQSPVAARLRIFDRDFARRGADPIDPAVPLLAARGTIQAVNNFAVGSCPDVAIGLPQPAPPFIGGVVRVVDVCTAALVKDLQPGVPLFGASLAASGPYLAVGAPATASPVVHVYDLSTGSTTPIRTITGASGSSFGWSLAFGDMNGDGFTDLAVGAPQLAPDGSLSGPGSVIIYNGFGGWMSELRTLTSPGPTSNAAFGYALSSGYDARGPAGPSPDGKHDLLVGAPGNLGRGSVFWYGWHEDTNPPPIRFDGEAAEDLFGASVLLARDATGDLRPDAVAGAPLHDVPGRADCGAAYLGQADGTLCTAPDRPTGSGPGAQFGTSLSEAGDVDENQFVDILVGQPDPGGLTQGTVYQYQVLR